MRYIWSIFIMIATVCANAQTVQLGVVKEYNEKAQKTPLSGVELNVRSAGSTVSDNKGGFLLSFLTLKPGERVNVRRIEKLGYEVFNKEAVEQWNLNLSNIYRHIKEYERADSLLRQGLKSLANMDYVDAKTREGIDYYQAIMCENRGLVATEVGRFDEARKYCAEALMGLRQLYDLNADKYVSELAIANYNMGRSYIMQDENLKEGIPYFLDALTLYEKVLNQSFVQKIFDNYSETLGVLGRSYLNNSDTVSCRDLCDRGIQLLHVCSDFPYKGATLMSAIASIYADIKEYKLSVEYHSRAINAIKVMYSEYPGIYKEQLARMYVNHGMTSCQYGDLNISKDSFSKGITLYEELYEENLVSKILFMDALQRGYMFLAISAEYQEGLVYLRKLQYLQPENIKLFENECIILYGNGHIEEAKTAFTKLLKHFTDYPKDSVLYQELSTH